MSNPDEYPLYVDDRELRLIRQALAYVILNGHVSADVELASEMLTTLSRRDLQSGVLSAPERDGNENPTMGEVAV